jgi:hypothetical protein
MFDKLKGAADDGTVLTLGLVGLVVGASFVMNRGSRAVYSFDSASKAGLQLGTKGSSRSGEALANFRWRKQPIYKDDETARRQMGLPGVSFKARR